MHIDEKTINLVLVPFILSFIITIFITPIVIYFTKKYGLIDDPKRKHPAILHSKPLPRGGGIALFFGAFFASIILLPWNNITGAIFLSAFIALSIGVIDDALNAKSKEISPYLRFLVNILCAVIIVGSGITVPFITHPFGGIFHFDSILIINFWGFTLTLAQVVAVLWIVWVINMLNWSSGVDGQVSGIVAISAIIIGILSLRFASNELVLIDAKLSFIIAGTSIGFLFYHFHPSKILPGYGATALYLLVAIVSILSSSKLATAILVLGIPSVDAVFTILRRILSGKSPFAGDRRHLHHILLTLGLSQRKIALFYWLISAIVGVITLQLRSQNKFFALLVMWVTIFGALIFLHLFLWHKHEKNND